MPNPTLQYHSDPQQSGLSTLGKFRQIQYDALVTIEAGEQSDKMLRYEQLVVSMLKDQWAWLKDPAHRRVIDGSNAVESLRIAEAATRMAEVQ